MPPIMPGLMDEMFERLVSLEKRVALLEAGSKPAQVDIRVPSEPLRSHQAVDPPAKPHAPAKKTTHGRREER